jgi:hypothetical protein
MKTKQYLASTCSLISADYILVLFLFNFPVFISAGL